MTEHPSGIGRNVTERPSGMGRNVTERPIPEGRLLRRYTHLLKRTAITLAKFCQAEFRLLNITASNRCIAVKITLG